MKPLIVLLACLLFAFAGLISASVGSFFAGHALLAAGTAALLGAIAFPALLARHDLA